MAAIQVLVAAVTLCGFWVMFSSETTTPSLTGRPTVLAWLSLLKRVNNVIYQSLYDLLINRPEIANNKVHSVPKKSRIACWFSLYFTFLSSN